MVANSPSTRSPRLNPFVFPSNTDFFFALLIASVLGANIFIYNWLFFFDRDNRDYQTKIELSCFAQFQASGWANPSNLQDYGDPRFIDARQSYQNCRAPLQYAIVAWELAGDVLLLVISAVTFAFYPLWKIRTGRLIPLSVQDAPEVVKYLSELCREVGILRMPSFVWNPLNSAVSGLAFGRLGRSYVALTGGLVTQFYTDRSAFRAILLHELAHIYNADINKTYFTVAVWQAFLLTGLLPFIFTLITYSSFENLNLLWRVIALTVVVYLIRNATLRAREFYADVRASVWDGTLTIHRVINTLPHTKSSRLQTALRVHPNPVKRHEVLDDTISLFRMGFWIALATGISTMIAFSSVEVFFSSVLTGTSQPYLASYATAILFTPLAIGVIGLGVWRATFATVWLDKNLLNLGRLALGLGLGILMGDAMSFVRGLPFSEIVNQTFLDEIILSVTYMFSGLVLVLGLWLLLKWIALGASAWLVISQIESVQLIYRIGLVLAGSLMAVWLGSYFLSYNDSQSFVILTFGIPQFAIVNPLTTLALVCLWAFPLATSLRGKTNLRTDLSAFLESEVHRLEHSNLPPNRLRFATWVGAIGGVIFCVLYSAVRVVLRISLSEEARNTDAVKLTSYFGGIVLAVLIQVVIATVIATSVKRLGGTHGLFGAFFASCIMTVGILELNLLFGGTIEASFAWQTFALVVNGGGFLVLPIAFVVSVIATFVRRSRAEPTVQTT